MICMYVAADYLNPQYRWSPNVSEHLEIKRGFYDVMERLMKDTTIYLKIEDQLVAYKEKRGLFGYKVTWLGDVETMPRTQVLCNKGFGSYTKLVKHGKNEQLDDPVVVEHVLLDDERIAAPSDGEEDNIEGGGTIGEGSRTRKRKNVQVNLIDDDGGVKVNWGQEDEDDPFESDANDVDYFI
uniref:Uncharacterized protein n=1 Tax=Lactuca sativa TaxID=4236 RepID=A0A9R1WS72_LACSA|nr:hypothetical protein LSAT_V11C100006560 [Lactuca sativa]